MAVELVKRKGRQLVPGEGFCGTLNSRKASDPPTGHCPCTPPRAYQPLDPPAFSGFGIFLGCTHVYIIKSSWSLAYSYRSKWQLYCVICECLYSIKQQKRVRNRKFDCCHRWTGKKHFYSCKGFLPGSNLRCCKRPLDC